MFQFPTKFSQYGIIQIPNVPDQKGHPVQGAQEMNSFPAGRVVSFLLRGSVDPFYLKSASMYFAMLLISRLIFSSFRLIQVTYGSVA